jgi:hypothetical protein
MRTNSLKNNLLASLLLLPKISYASLKEEQKMCVEFANEMRQWSLEGNLPYVWFHVANEFLPSARVNYSFEAKLKHMGKMSGVPDYCFLGDKDSFFIEFKTEKGRQTQTQKTFEEWCATTNVDYFLCRSAREGIGVVRERIGGSS